jgi:hypothetical protein
MYTGALGQVNSDFQPKADYIAGLASEYNTAVRDYMAVFPSSTRALITNLQVFPQDGFGGVRFTFNLGNVTFQLFSISDLENMVNDVKGIDLSARTKTAEQYAILANAGVTVNVEAPQVEAVTVPIVNLPIFGPVSPGIVSNPPESYTGGPSGPAPAPSKIVPDVSLLPSGANAGGNFGVIGWVLIGLLGLAIFSGGRKG